MEPISIDTIEQADFFVWNLDPKQLEELKEKYLERQPYLTNFFNVAATFGINQNQQDYVFLLYLVILISFNYYGFTFPEFEMEEHLKTIHYWKDYFMKGGKNPTNYRRQKILIQESKQTPLTNYILHKYEDAKAGNRSLFSEDNPVPILNLYLLIEFLNKEVEKLEGDDKGEGL